MSNVTLDPQNAASQAIAIVRLQAVLEMTRTFQAFIAKTREVDRDDVDFQFAAHSCHDALTLNLCALRDHLLPQIDPGILSRPPVQTILREIERIESSLPDASAVRT